MNLTRNQKIAGGVGGATLGAVLAVLVPFTAVREGFVNHVYRDSVGVATYCYGETLNPQAGRIYTRAECDAKLADRLAEFDGAVISCVTTPLPLKTRAAFDDLAYNIGKGAFCGSTLARKANAGDLTGACNEMPRWNRAGGMVLKGLSLRRGDERALCLEGVAEGK